MAGSLRCRNERRANRNILRDSDCWCDRNAASIGKNLRVGDRPPGSDCSRRCSVGDGKCLARGRRHIQEKREQNCKAEKRRGRGEPAYAKCCGLREAVHKAAATVYIPLPV